MNNEPQLPDFCSEREEISQAVRELLQVPNDGGKVLTAINTLLIYIGNVLQNPDDPKFHKIGALNKAFLSRVGSIPEALAVLKHIGWITGVETDFFVLKGITDKKVRYNMNLPIDLKSFLFETTFMFLSGRSIRKASIRQSPARKCEIDYVVCCNISTSTNPCAQRCTV